MVCCDTNWLIFINIRVVAQICMNAAQHCLVMHQQVPDDGLDGLIRVIVDDTPDLCG